ncbi:MAG TPA: anti-sigma regulatory factor, partial [Chroococcales cyanobacterium]
VKRDDDVIAARQHMRLVAQGLGFRLVEETKLVTVVSELARNMLVYGGGGIVTIDKVSSSFAVGVKAVFADQGPGIADVELALSDGFSTGNSLGLGLPGSKRMMHEFGIESELGKGTRVVVTHWKR